jgi:gamma-glutamyl-gamma-aminobutyrate hydrolase PuuD
MPRTTPFNVHIIGTPLGIDELFRYFGWNVTDNLDGADLVQFTGGADVDPTLYGEYRHATTNCTPARDKREILIYHYCIFNDKKMAGICRGGQFLNVMCGGTLWQDVDGHRGEHDATCLLKGERMKVSSTHHQMMIPKKGEGRVLMEARAAKRKTHMRGVSEVSCFNDAPDVEAVLYKDLKALCFQPHPEYNRKGKMAETYFEYIDKLLKGE